MRLALALALLGTPVLAQDCGAPLPDFIAGVARDATAAGIAPDVVSAFLSGAAIDDSVLRADRAQGVFQRDFIDFSRRLISADRIANGGVFGDRNDASFDRIEATFGIPREVILAFWAFETDYGRIQGDFNTRNALLTLAHDCRRPDLFRPQLIAAMELYARGDFDLDTTGAWAGEIGQVQMLPADIIDHAIDGDGDGHIRLKTSSADALLSGAHVLSSLGWQANQPWLQEITVPGTLDWSLTGRATKRSVADWAAMGVTARTGDLADPTLPSSIILPMGRNGPAFIAYPNFDVYFEWNQSFTYVLTAAYFATRLAGAPVYDAGTPEPGLSGDQLKALQSKLAARGHDVGKIDGILGAGTRAAVQAEQQRLGMPADAWPTTALLNAL